MIRNESDTAWKQVLDAYFKDFVEYCLPELYGLINWDKHWTSLDKELNAITKGSDAGKRLLDKLFRVYLKDGKEQWVLVHLEVQGNREEDFPKRMFTYGYRIYDKYQRPVTSCAILTDENKSWRPSSYQIGLAGSYLSTQYLVVKLIDWRGTEEELDASPNPFASVILSQLKALAIKKKPDEERKQVKMALTRRLYEKGFKKEEVINLYKFVDWLIGLPKPFELEYDQEVLEFEEAKKMAYISRIERNGIEAGVQIGIEQGIEQGMEKGIEQVARHLLEEGVETSLIIKTTGFSVAKIKKLQAEIKQANKGKKS